MLVSESARQLMERFRQGDESAGAQLIELFYPDLKRMAASRMQRERQNHTWQPTVLISELYLALRKIKAMQQREGESSNDPAAFLALADTIMMRLLIRHARASSSKAIKVDLDDELLGARLDDRFSVEQMLDRLSRVKPVLRTVVEMKVFGGQTAEEIAAELGYAPVTIHRYWQLASKWLRHEMNSLKPEAEKTANSGPGTN